MEYTSNPHGAPQTPEHPKPTLPAGPSTAIQIVWQWATYVLWASALFLLSVFLTALLAYFFNDGSASDFEYAAYFFAALLCVLPLAFFADKVYRKHEPTEKHGFAAVVMVISAILVFLAVLGGLITTVVSLVSLLISTTSSEMGIVIASSLIITALGALLLLRILNLPRFAAVTKWFHWIVVAVAVVATVFAFAGPFRSLVASKNDRLIEQNITSLDSEIQDYAFEHGKLPATLDDLTFDDSYQADAKALVSRKLVTYRPDADQGQSLYGSTLTYRLCATFKNRKGNGITEETSLYTISNNHGKGEQCYRLEVTTYGEDSVDLYKYTPELTAPDALTQ